MSNPSQDEVNPSLKDLFGHEIALISENGEDEVFRILAEFEWQDVHYVALQNEALKSDDEVDLLRVIIRDGEPQLETIDDEDEWESVAEAYDDLLFANEERP